MLGDAYPHLLFSLKENSEIDAWAGSELSYEEILGILDARLAENKSTQNDKTPLHSLHIIDGKSIVATMEVFKKAKDVPAAMHLLRLSVNSLIHNQTLRKRMVQEKGLILTGDNSNDNDLQEAEKEKSELRRVYKAVFSLLGHSSQRRRDSCSPRLIMYLLHRHMPDIAKIQPGSEAYHAAMNALGKFGAFDLIVELLEQMELTSTTDIKVEPKALVTMAPPVDRMAYQTAISSLARHGHCREATHLVKRMQSKGIEQPDLNIYNELLIGIAKEAGKGIDRSSIRSNNKGSPLKPWHQVALEILHEIESNSKPTAQTYNSVISTCMKEGQWDAARLIEKAAPPAEEDEVCQSKLVGSSPNTLHAFGSAYFQNLKSNFKVGKGGKDTWWEIGCHFTDDKCKSNKNRGIIIGIQPHRNPLSNGISIVFFNETSSVRIGRILLKNTCSNNIDENESSLVGMEVSKARRGKGLSKVFIAIWLRICLETGTYPRAAVMNKPLIAYVLMGFNFVPQKGGSCVELIRLNDNDTKINKDEDECGPKFALYSPSAKSLQGLFSRRVLNTQNIVILDSLPPSISMKQRTTIYLKTKFEHPIAIMEHAVEHNTSSFVKGKRSLIDSKGCGDQLQNHKQRTKGGDPNPQRKLLDKQIHHVLKTDNAKGTMKNGCLEFFSNNTSLKHAFLP